jgi:hypothetical protein
MPGSVAQPSDTGGCATLIYLTDDAETAARTAAWTVRRGVDEEGLHAPVDLVGWTNTAIHHKVRLRSRPAGPPSRYGAN